jgi:hypothetical protein
MNLLDLREIAEREEARLATAVADVTREWRPRPRVWGSAVARNPAKSIR